MTTPPNPPTNDDRDPIAQLHQALVDDLATTFDLGAGAADVTQVRHHARLVADLGGTLDLDAGLATIVGVSEPRADVEVASPNSGLVQLADQLGQLEPAARIALRAGTESRALKHALNLDHDLASTRNFALWEERNHVHFQARDLDRARDLARGLAHDLGLACDRFQDFDGDLAHDLARARDLARGLAHDLAEVRRWAIAGDADTDLDQFPDTARRLVIIAAMVLARVIGPEASRPSAAPRTASDQEIEHLDRALDRAMNDFVGADLQAARLDGAAIEGIRWSLGTRWPDGWVERIRVVSAEIEPGLFEIQGWERNRRHQAVTT